MLIDKMNRKQKRKFNKLSPDEQAPIIEAELIQKVSPIMAKEIAKAMITGMDLVYEKLFDEFVNPLDTTDSEDEWNMMINNLLSLIRTQYLRIETNKANEQA